MSRSTAKPLRRCACIDIGSNTTRLLVAEEAAARPRELLTERAFTRLGSVCESAGEIGAGAADEVAAVVARQVALARELGVPTPRIVATAAVREATDRDRMTAVVAASCGLELEILSCEDEARLAFAGAVGMLPSPPSGLLGVVDVGGGSTELVVGTATEGATWSVSLALGSCVVTDRHLPSDPPSVAEIAAVRTRLADVFAAIDVPRPVSAYVVGGSASSMQRLLGSVLDRDTLTRGLQRLVGLPAAEVAVVLGLHAERARLLPASLLLLDAASHALEAPLRLAGGGLREGVVLEQFAQLARPRSASRQVPPSSQSDDVLERPA
jgi:exopolyphosphatase/guanosine-5'-triphosphate,3'-diphosphate pyrophosphatase